jgi:hypothetical protein
MHAFARPVINNLSSLEAHTWPTSRISCSSGRQRCAPAQLRMLGLRVRALGHTGGAVSVTVQAAALALHDERPGRAAGAPGQSPAAALAAAASTENATVLINDAWQWEQAGAPRGRPRGPGALGREAGDEAAPAWQRVRGAVATGEGPFGAPAARLARHSSFKWGAAGPLAAPRTLHPDPAGLAGPPRPPPARLASAHTAAIRSPSHGAPQGAAQGPEYPEAGATPGASRPCSEAGEGGGALGAGSGAGDAAADGGGGDEEASLEPRADGFFLEYVLHNAALGPARGPQVSVGWV